MPAATAVCKMAQLPARRRAVPADKNPRVRPKAPLISCNRLLPRLRRRVPVPGAYATASSKSIARNGLFQRPDLVAGVSWERAHPDRGVMWMAAM